MRAASAKSQEVETRILVIRRYQDGNGRSAKGQAESLVSRFCAAPRRPTRTSGSGLAAFSCTGEGVRLTLIGHSVLIALPAALPGRFDALGESVLSAL